MLFEKIRRTQKPVFIFLAITFGLGFAALGVGSGAGGVNAFDFLTGNNSGSGGSSISGLLAKVQKNSKDATSWLALARAYTAKGQTDPALSAYDRYLVLQPKDATALSEAATLAEQRAQGIEAQAAAYQQLLQEAQAVSSGPAVSALKFSSSFTMPFSSSALGDLQARAGAFQQQAAGDYQQAVDLRKKEFALQPQDSTLARILAQDALRAQDYTTAVSAIRQVLKLEPQATDKAQLQQTLVAVQQYLKTQAGSGSQTGSSGSK
ncbi:MAG: tetratricopeptide repeat protein [Gaiellales bacterium]